MTSFDIGIIHPCSIFEKGGWEWWLMGCWLPFSVVEIGFVVLATVAVATVVRRRLGGLRA